MDDTTAFLRARIEHDHQVVTYRMLSRARHMDVHAARAALRTFKEAHPHVHAVYVVSTPETIALVPEDEVDATRTEEALLYALQPQAKWDPALLAHAGHMLARDPAYAKQRDEGLAAFGALSNRFHVGAAPPPVPLSTSGPPPASNAPRKRRKVIKQVRVKNEKGYMVTNDVEVSESDEEAPAPAPVPAAPAAARTASPAKAPRSAQTKGKGQQSSLMSFFSKST
ncbi:hypothetical protein MNAN1_001092 [Malassezia nana]|uniref:DNA polymerase delta subunit 3 n=1 Tax=Malassezia nana TaxID=180528 RepID=A0AAF0EQ20_9BASI|nr:hypothetical protein MNAN1_001092 [Malassezia nana]